MLPIVPIEGDAKLPIEESPHGWLSSSAGVGQVRGFQIARAELEGGALLTSPMCALSQ